MSPRSFRSLASVSLWVLALSACGQVVTSETAGDASGDSADAVSNLAPTVAIGSPLPGQIINKDEKLQLAAQVSDDRDLAETLTVRWYSDHQTEPLFDGKAGSDGKVALEVGPLPLGVRTLTVQAIDSAGLETKVDVKVFVNTAPGAPTIAIEPVKPTSIDDLQAKIVTPAVDPDRAASELTYSYKWFAQRSAHGRHDRDRACRLDRQGRRLVRRGAGARPGGLRTRRQGRRHHRQRPAVGRAAGDRPQPGGPDVGGDLHDG